MALPLPELPGVEHAFHDLPTGVRVHVAQAGPADAPPVLLLHGWPQHWWCFRRVLPLLQDDHRLLAMDLRGLGWSGAPADGDYAKQPMAGDALALLDALGIQRALLVGHDWGGWVGFLTALQAPERLTGLLALGIAHPWQPPARLVRNLHRFLYQLPLATPVLGERLVRSGAAVPRVLRAAWGDRETYDDAAEREFGRAYREPEAARASSAYYRTFLLHEAPQGASGAFAGRRLEPPARLLFGERDPLGTALAEGLERHGDDARVEILPGCGHFVPEERPEAVAAAVRQLAR